LGTIQQMRLYDRDPMGVFGFRFKGCCKEMELDLLFGCSSLRKRDVCGLLQN
jgi:hypothetical protein